jgi:hypothetical protein
MTDIVISFISIWANLLGAFGAILFTIKIAMQSWLNGIKESGINLSKKRKEEIKHLIPYLFNDYSFNKQEELELLMDHLYSTDSIRLYPTNTFQYKYINTDDITKIKEISNDFNKLWVLLHNKLKESYQEIKKTISSSLLYYSQNNWQYEYFSLATEFPQLELLANNDEKKKALSQLRFYANPAYLTELKNLINNNIANEKKIKDITKLFLPLNIVVWVVVLSIFLCVLAFVANLHQYCFTGYCIGLSSFLLFYGTLIIGLSIANHSEIFNKPLIKLITSNKGISAITIFILLLTGIIFHLGTIYKNQNSVPRVNKPKPDIIDTVNQNRLFPESSRQVIKGTKSINMISPYNYIRNKSTKKY